MTAWRRRQNRRPIAARSSHEAIVVGPRLALSVLQSRPLAARCGKLEHNHRVSGSQRMTVLMRRLRADRPSCARGIVRFLGNPHAYWSLLIRGAVLLMVTLGIYRFWLATDIRRFLWANTEIAGDSLNIPARRVSS